MTQPLWLEFDNEVFEGSRATGESEYYGFLNVKVTNDNDGGNSEVTEITLDTDGYGGNDIELQIKQGGQYATTYAGVVKITLRGTFEASAFFEGMRNMLTTYDLQRKLGV